MAHDAEGKVVSEKALVVDDEPIVLETLVHYCSHLGLEAMPAGGAAEALTLLRDDPAITVLITDVRMPGIDGIELARRAEALRPGLKIILATGYCRSDGVPWPVLAKPYLVGDLERSLREAGARG